MFASERKVIGATVPDAEQALTEQYGRSSLHERGRSEGSVSYLVRITSKAPALATILPNPNGITLRIAPHIGKLAGAIYAIFILIGLVMLIVPGLFVAFFLLLQIWFTGKVIGRHIDNIARGTEHQAKLRQLPATEPPLPENA